MSEKALERIRQRMNALGISQAELAKRTGIRPSSISDYLNGRYAPKQDKIALIAEALNVSPAWLMGLGSDITGKEEQKMYYTDPKVNEMAERLRTSGNTRLLFDATEDMSEDDIEFVVKLIEKMKGK